MVKTQIESQIDTILGTTSDYNKTSNPSPEALSDLGTYKTWTRVTQIAATGSDEIANTNLRQYDVTFIVVQISYATPETINDVAAEAEQFIQDAITADSGTNIWTETVAYPHQEARYYTMTTEYLIENYTIDMTN